MLVETGVLGAIKVIELLGVVNGAEWTAVEIGVLV
jgi:hypothetical protein